MRKLATLIILVMSSPAGATTLPAYWHNREALKNLANKQPYSAYKELLKALEKDPLNPVLQMNLGLAFSANKEYQKAEQAYQGALELLPEKSPDRFKALFNLAQVEGLEGHIPDALAAYQAALDIQPDSLPVKTNIELLLRQQQGKNGKGQSNSNNQSGKNQNQGQNQSKGQNKQSQNQNQQMQQQQQQKPQPFKSQDLSREDVKKILDEIKNQEQSIRAKAYERGVKQPAPNGKDW